MDGKLFLVRHLLILKEMTQGLALGRRDRAREWAGITGKFCSSIHILQLPWFGRKMTELLTDEKIS